MVLKIHKVVSALPSQLEPDAVYAVRTGDGFDLHIADSTGSVAHKVNTGTPVTLTTFTDPVAFEAAADPVNGLLVLYET